MRSLKLTALFILLQTLLLNAQYPGIYTFAGTNVSGYSGDGGPALNAQFNQLWGVAVDDAGNVYVIDRPNQRIRKINKTTGIVTTFAGNGIAGFSGDGGPAIGAKLNHPVGLAFDAAGNLYIADSKNYRIRKVNPAGIILTVAGNGTYTGNLTYGVPATSTSINEPGSVACDQAGNLYIGEMSTVMKVNPGGIISRYAGGNGIYMSGNGGDGGSALSATVGVNGIVTDARGNIYISDYQRIRKINAAGIISNYAGGGPGPASGPYTSVPDGGLATDAVLENPSAMAFDADSNLYITELAHIRKVDTAGMISTYLGPYFTGFANAESFPYPFLWNTSGIAFDAEGSAYITDWGPSFRVLKTCDCAVGIETRSSTANYSLSPNPGNGAFTIRGKPGMADQLIVINASGQQVHEQAATGEITEVNLTMLSKGLFYYLLLKDKQPVGRGKLMIE